MERTATAKKWQEILQDFESGGLRRKEFCEARGTEALHVRLLVGAAEENRRR